MAAKRRAPDSDSLLPGWQEYVPDWGEVCRLAQKCAAAQKGDQESATQVLVVAFWATRFAEEIYRRQPALVHEVQRKNSKLREEFPVLRSWRRQDTNITKEREEMLRVLSHGGAPTLRLRGKEDGDGLYRRLKDDYLPMAAFEKLPPLTPDKETRRLYANTIADLIYPANSPRPPRLGDSRGPPSSYPLDKYGIFRAEFIDNVASRLIRIAGELKMRPKL